jgi:hypothetical protein
MPDLVSTADMKENEAVFRDLLFKPGFGKSGELIPKSNKLLMANVTVRFQDELLLSYYENVEVEPEENSTAKRDRSEVRENCLALGSPHRI